MKSKSLLEYTLLAFSLAMNNPLYGQDTLYADAYPNGIISENYEEKGLSYIIYPIDNPKYRIKFNKKELEMIAKADGEVFLNPEYDAGYFEKTKMVTLPAAPRTGKIRVEAIIANNKLTKDELYKSLVRLSDEIRYQGGPMYAAVRTNTKNPGTQPQFRILSESPSSKDFISYEMSLNAKFAGDDVRLVSVLKLYFKEGKVKLVLNDFYAFIGIVKKSGSGATTNNQDQLENFYPVRRSDIKKFWVPIYNGVNYTVDLVKHITLTAKNNSGDEDDW